MESSKKPTVLITGTDISFANVYPRPPYSFSSYLIYGRVGVSSFMSSAPPLGFALAGYESSQVNGRWFSLRRVGPGCLFWIVVSVVLSVTLIILLNLPFLFFG